MWSYAEIGDRLAAGPPEHGGYAEWIAVYASEDLARLAAWARELTDTVAAGAAEGAWE